MCLAAAAAIGRQPPLLVKKGQLPSSARWRVAPRLVSLRHRRGRRARASQLTAAVPVHVVMCAMSSLNGDVPGRCGRLGRPDADGSAARGLAPGVREAAQGDGVADACCTAVPTTKEPHANCVT
jgi:hypothetical protein